MPPPPIDIALRPTNAARPPDWRWQLATALAEHGTTTFPDPLVQEAAEFIAVRNSLESSALEWDLYTHNPTMYDAHALHKTPAGAQVLDRWQLEARIVSGQEEDEIHERTGYSVPVIQKYSAIFFDIRDRLQHSDFITSHILGRQIHLEKKLDLEPLMKLIGWSMGPTALDWFLNKGRAATLLHESSDPNRRMDAVYSRVTRLRAAVSAYFAPMYGDMHGINFEAYGRLRDLELKAQVIGVKAENDELLSGFYQSIADFQYERAKADAEEEDPFEGEDPFLVSTEIAEAADRARIEAEKAGT